jgi:hypothetical protein
MRIVGVLLLASVALAGCSAVSNSATTSSEAAIATSTPSSTPTPTTVAVDPTRYATVDQIGDTIAGVDFDSADRNLHCGIYDPYGSNGTFTAPFSGCVPDHYDFVFPGDSPIGPPNSVFLEGSAAATITTTTDVEFPGQDPQRNPNIAVLAPGSSLTWSSVKCTAIDDGIRCDDASSGHGFFVSRARYEVH